MEFEPRIDDVLLEQRQRGNAHRMPALLEPLPERNVRLDVAARSNGDQCDFHAVVIRRRRKSLPGTCSTKFVTKFATMRGRLKAKMCTPTEVSGAAEGPR